MIVHLKFCYIRLFFDCAFFLCVCVYVFFLFVCLVFWGVGDFVVVVVVIVVVFCLFVCLFVESVICSSADCPR